MGLKFGSRVLLLALLGMLPFVAQADRRSYIVAGASNTSDLVTHEFNYSNSLFFNHFALEREITDEIRVGISYWNYGTAGASDLVATLPDPVTGLPITI